MKRLWLAVPLLMFAALAAVMWRALETRAAPSPTGQPVPAFALPRLDDGDLHLRRDDLLGRAWVLNAWASWCAACVDEHPALAELAKENAAPIVGLLHKDTRIDGLAWLGRHGDPYAMTALDADGRAGMALGLRGVPETLVIDRRGVVRFRHAGALTPALVDARIRPLLKALNAEAAP